MNQEKGLNAKQVPYMDARERVMGYTQFLKRYWAWENGITLYKNPENHSDHGIDMKKLAMVRFKKI